MNDPATVPSSDQASRVATTLDVPPSGRREAGLYTRQRILLSLAVAAMGAVDLLSAFLSRPPERLLAIRRILPTEVLDTSRTFTLLAGALLLVTAWGLRRGKRRAYVTALFLCAVSVPMNVLKALDIEEAMVATGLMFLLAISADAFRVRSRELTSATLRSGALWFALALLVYSLVGSWLLDHWYGVALSWERAFRDAGYYLFGIGDPVTFVTHPLPLREERIVTWYHRSLPILSLSFVISLAVASLRPARHRRRHIVEAGRVAKLLESHGDSSVSAFALGDDVDYFFSRNGRAVIAYRFESDTLLGIGDPIGPPEERVPLLQEFEQHCRDRDWQFAFFQARPEYLDLYRSLGWRWIHIGEDPVLWADRFTLDGGAVSEARRAVRKAEKAGLEAHMFIPGQTPFTSPASDALIESLRAISSEWLRAHAGSEKSFCMGRFDPQHLPDTWVAVAWNPTAHRVEGFLTWERIWARRGWALDLMRRRLDSAPGTMEFLIARSVEIARQRGDAMLSLALSALARVGVEPPAEVTPLPGTAPPADAATADTDRARAFLMEHLARFYDFKGLFQWKKKFAPEFEDRYLVYPNTLGLPRVTLALVRAQSPGGIGTYVRQLLPSRSDAAA